MPERIRLSCYSTTGRCTLCQRESGCLVTLLLRSVRYARENPVVLLLCHWVLYVMPERIRLSCYSATGFCTLCQRESDCLVTLPLGAVRYARDNPVVLLLCYCALYVMPERIRLFCYSATALCTLCQRESGCLVTLSLRSVRYARENPVVLLLCYCALYVMPEIIRLSCYSVTTLCTLCQRESGCLVALLLRSVCYIKKASSYIAQYPVLRTVQSALHFTSLTDLFTQTLLQPIM